MSGELRSVEDALAQVLAAVPGQTSIEAVNLVDALGRVLAEPVVSAIDLPPWDNSAMDGYAVRAADVLEASPERPVWLRVVGDAAAGASGHSEPLHRGEAFRIATGALIPPGADAVVPVEETVPADAEGRPLAPVATDLSGPPGPGVLVRTGVAMGASIRRRADDVRAGDVVLSAGAVVSPPAVAVAAGVGAAYLRVRASPIVGVLVTGDELRTAGSPLGRAGIPDANGPSIAALVTAAGGDARSLGIARDTLDDVRARLCAGLAEGADLIVVSGGVSVGPFDHVRTVFAEVGSVDLWRVAVQPGKPFAFGTGSRPDGGSSLLFGLPGNPVSTVVTFELFVRPAIRALLGLAGHGRRTDRAVLLDGTTKSRGRRAFLRVVAERDADGAPVRDPQGRVRVRLAGGPSGQGSHVLSALARAEALAVVPEALTSADPGTEVALRWLDAG